MAVSLKGGAALNVELDDLRGLLQPKAFCVSMIQQQQATSSTALQTNGSGHLFVKMLRLQTHFECCPQSHTFFHALSCN